MLEKPGIRVTSVERCIENSPHNYYKLWLIQGFDFGIRGYKTRTNPDIHTTLIRATFSQSPGQNQLRGEQS